uniref:Uncharacterized protein n=1 Tax=Chromera velia CCMP2878 TaxID=1169474 RepID=A0A0G4IBY2_9ALVE|mmetsp:Transcript_39527/g.77789  ORF Transcript_39527/g.77789 Transcript_39527/m.77789 type:complete len:655 (+) Transcript_39527:403-2367(+)|eukprot:Cvel_12950.t1-p1 / transcript=Cvel_12950.t1 / gene=Cvel_12950 / organism=Chromera_velia_CCMP2878 / gene_product=hypothetical protein / transcript_product=hypothetical protein / location=Cvel_scaffold866:56664-59991(-) / protein_length=654 / sequence_SO=supercontig / SO=protein_coding / is_pseudo=false
MDPNLKAKILGLVKAQKKTKKKQVLQTEAAGGKKTEGGQGDQKTSTVVQESYPGHPGSPSSISVSGKGHSLQGTDLKTPMEDCLPKFELKDRAAVGAAASTTATAAAKGIEKEKEGESHLTHSSPSHHPVISIHSTTTTSRTPEGASSPTSSVSISDSSSSPSPNRIMMSQRGGTGGCLQQQQDGGTAVASPCDGGAQTQSLIRERKVPLRPKDWLSVECEDGTAFVQPQLLECFEHTPLFFALCGTPEGLQPSRRLACPRWVMEALGHYSVYKTLPRLPPPDPLEREEELLAFADFFMLDAVSAAVESRRRQRELLKSEEGKEKRRQEVEKARERLAKKFEMNKSYICPRDPKFEEIGRMRGVLPPLLSVEDVLGRKSSNKKENQSGGTIFQGQSSRRGGEEREGESWAGRSRERSSKDHLHRERETGGSMDAPPSASRRRTLSSAEMRRLRGDSDSESFRRASLLTPKDPGTTSPQEAEGGPRRSLGLPHDWDHEGDSQSSRSSGRGNGTIERVKNEQGTPTTTTPLSALSPSPSPPFSSSSHAPTPIEHLSLSNCEKQEKGQKEDERGERAHLKEEGNRTEEECPPKPAGGITTGELFANFPDICSQEAESFETSEVVRSATDTPQAQEKTKGFLHILHPKRPSPSPFSCP